MSDNQAQFRINVLCRLYFSEFYDHRKRRCEVGGSDGRRLIADIGAQIEYRKEVLAGDLETIFGHLERISDLESGSYGVWVDGVDGIRRDIQPNDMDYTQARDQAAQEENDDMNAAIEALLLGGNDE